MWMHLKNGFKKWAKFEWKTKRKLNEIFKTESGGLNNMCYTLLVPCCQCWCC